MDSNKDNQYQWTSNYIFIERKKITRNAVTKKQLVKIQATYMVAICIGNELKQQ